MSTSLRIVIFIIGTMFTLTVVYLLVKRKISERNSLLWLLGSFGVFIISMFPQLLDKLAGVIGVEYPPALLFLIATVILLFINLYNSVQITSLNSQLKELTQYVLVNEHTGLDSSSNLIPYKEFDCEFHSVSEGDKEKYASFK